MSRNTTCRNGDWKRAQGLLVRLSVCVLLLQALAPATARTYLVYEFDRSRGLDSTGTGGLIQDRSGFIWIGGHLSLFRYDGREFRRWNKEPLPGNPEWYADDLLEGLLIKLAFPSDQIVKVTNNGFEPYEPQIEPPLNNIRNMTATVDGSLWIFDAIGLRHRDADRKWRTVPVEKFDGVKAHRIQATPGGGVLVMTREHLWRVDAGGDPIHLTTAQHLISAARETAEGRIFLAYGGPPGGTLSELVDGRLEVLATHTVRSIDLVVRGDAVWVGFDFALLRWHPTEGTDVITRDSGFFTGGGSLLLDHENSLWIGGYANLAMIPEASTSVWTPDDGLGLNTLSWVVEGADGIWVTSYAGVDLISRDGSNLNARTTLPGFSPNRICADGAGRIWHTREDRYTLPTEVYESLGGRQTVHQFEDTARDGTCTPAIDGRMWIVRGQILYKTNMEGGRPVPVTTLPGDGRVQSIYESKNGELWVGYFQTTCHAPAEMVGTEPDIWQCINSDQLTWSRTFAETNDGELWLHSSQGLYRWTGEEWRPLSGLPEGQIYQLTPSPRKGIWIAAREYIARVTPDPQDPDRVNIIERLTMWQGIPNETGSSVVEQDNGTVWVATRRGLVQVPPEVRDQKLPVPRVELVDVFVDNDPFPLNGGEVELPWSQNRVEVRFAAMSYRNPGLIRYRVRSRPEEEWSETRTPEFRFVDLAPGDYHPEVAASLDGRNWSEAPAGFAFTVLPPWYVSWWAIALYIVLTMAFFLTLYRIRLAFHLRAERQRTRIAMDLHDEMGSGLGSIGILSGVLHSEDLPLDDRQSVIRQIEQTAEELGAALADIVWSLRPRARTLGAVLVRIEKLARRLLPSPQVEIVLAIDSSHEPVVVTHPVCRNVLAIASEALHNAARHGKPERVTISLAPIGRQWRLTIEDDGVGFNLTGQTGDGLGLQSMPRRSRDIGAAFSLESSLEAGTCVILTFHPQAGDRRVGASSQHDHADGESGRFGQTFWRGKRK